MRNGSRTIVVLQGGPGSGKGTQAQIISTLLGIPQISTGQLVRAEITQDTAGRNILKACVESGGLVDDFTINALVARRIRMPDCHRGFILDGYPRNIGQAVALEYELQGTDRLIVISIASDLETVIARLAKRWTCIQCGASYTLASSSSISNSCENCGTVLVRRSDDHEHVIRSRFETFKREAVRLAGFYKRRGVFHAVDGTRSPDEVTAAITSILRNFSVAVANHL